jgi:curved DNA-binding protein CbpA
MSAGGRYSTAMARPPDPYRTLGVTRGATLDEVKAAYRRLAKLYHPDSAGERALERFLAIQAAYESLTEGPARLRLGTARRSTTASPRSRRTAEPDPDRGRSTRTSGPGPRSTSGGQRTGAAGSGSGRTGAAGSGSTGSSTSGPGGATRPRPRRDRRKPTSTSYDGAEFEPFEPEWEGASWYGGSSGTYWTINPKEFADPRKHGPEYQARGRHAAAAEADTVAGTPETDRSPRSSRAKSPADSAAAASRDGDAALATGGAAQETTAGPAGPDGSAPDPAAVPDRKPGAEPVTGASNGHAPSFRASAARFVRGITGTRRGA